MTDKQEELIDEIQSIVEYKTGMSPIKTFGSGWYIYNFNSLGFEGKYNASPWEFVEKNLNYGNPIE